MVDMLKYVFFVGEKDSVGDDILVGWVGKFLIEFLFVWVIKFSQMYIVCEIKYDEDLSGDIDMVVFVGNCDWYEIIYFGKDVCGSEVVWVV